MHNEVAVKSRAIDGAFEAEAPGYGYTVSSESSLKGAARMAGALALNLPHRAVEVVDMDIEEDGWTWYRVREVQ